MIKGTELPGDEMKSGSQSLLFLNMMPALIRDSIYKMGNMIIL
ncbi:hypothetical protein HPL003_26030 [Paenibacillus terrae HPL-003]|uniref:Uncharacterized protein n=1 Tax=Paenibacillus terrae (strain HPL-003) TaxID=985665 RepID=G7VQU2_PAETH|nr:hypothetical protein HPL003_26030 [Paenibacillus terrae HPL-003]